MNNKLYNLISSIASLVMTIVLLVFVTLAWYTSNKDVSADGPQGQISAEGDISHLTLTRYIAKETKIENTETYTYTKDANKPFVQANIQPYDSLQQYSKIIYEISFTTRLESLTSLQLFIKNTSTSRTDVFEPDGNTYFNYLSNVAVFKELTYNNDGSYTISNPMNSAAIPYYSGIADATTHVVKFTSNPILRFDASINKYVITLLFDYNIDNINELYSANLGINSPVIFKDDIEFILKL